MRSIPLINTDVHAIVDDEDHADLSARTWCLIETPSGGLYARATINGARMHMHRLVAMRMGIHHNAETIDHRNRFGLDNRRSNLRPATYGQNGANRSNFRQSNVSGAPGVYKANKGWIVRFRRDGKTHYFGFYRDLDEAIAVARASATVVHGEFSPYGPKDDGMAAVHAASRQIVAYAQASGSLAPLQWIADQMGCDITVRSAAAAEKAQLMARLRELERRGMAA